MVKLIFINAVYTKSAISPAATIKLSAIINLRANVSLRNFAAIQYTTRPPSSGYAGKRLIAAIPAEANAATSVYGYVSGNNH